MSERPTDLPTSNESAHDATTEAAVGCGACDRCERLDLPFDIQEAAACIRLRDLAELTADQQPMRRAA